MYESFCYHPDKGTETGLDEQQIIDMLKDERSLVWIDMLDIDDTDIDFLTEVFNLHPLTIEDFIMPNARPKIEKFVNYLFLVMFSLESNGANGVKGSDRPKPAELDFCLGKNFLITFHSCPVSSIAVCKERSRQQSPTMTAGADMLLYSLLDSCVDSYFPIMQKLDTMVDDISDELFREPKPETLKRIYTLKNDMMRMKRTVGPQVDVISSIVRGESEFISGTNIAYYRNIYDGYVRLNDIVSASRDVISGAMEAYTSLISNRLNEVMKTLTIIATIMMPLTLIASIYGMNFKKMPALESEAGFLMVLASMAVISVGMLIYFKRRRWL